MPTSLVAALDRAAQNCPSMPPPYWNIVVHGSGAPDETSPTNWLFYVDDDTDVVFFNSDHTAAGFVEVVDNPTLGEGETVLTATTT